MLAQETRDGFLGQPKQNKEQCNLDCQNAKKKAENVAKAAVKKAATKAAATKAAAPPPPQQTAPPPLVQK